MSGDRCLECCKSSGCRGAGKGGQAPCSRAVGLNILQLILEVSHLFLERLDLITSLLVLHASLPHPRASAACCSILACHIHSTTYHSADAAQHCGVEQCLKIEPKASPSFRSPYERVVSTKETRIHSTKTQSSGMNLVQPKPNRSLFGSLLPNRPVRACATTRRARFRGHPAALRAVLPCHQPANTAVTAAAAQNSCRGAVQLRYSWRSTVIPKTLA